MSAGKLEKLQKQINTNVQMYVNKYALYKQTAMCMK